MAFVGAPGQTSNSGADRDVRSREISLRSHNDDQDQLPQQQSTDPEPEPFAAPELDDASDDDDDEDITPSSLNPVPVTRPRNLSQRHTLTTATSPTTLTSSPSFTSTTTTTTTNAAAAEGPSIQDAVRPQLSERDSIFATHYIPSDFNSALTPTIHSRPGKIVEGGSEGAQVAGKSAQRQPTRREITTTMAASPLRSQHLHHLANLPPALQQHHKDLPPSTLSLFQNQPLPLQQDSPRTRPTRTSLPLSQNRRSLYDLHHLTSLPIADIIRGLQSYDAAMPPTTVPGYNDLPATPSSGTGTAGASQDPDQSVERQQYRSWRKGQAKMNGMTIRESQRKPGKKPQGVDKVIDAQLPQPDPPMANARSRKASHYLGLFRENEAEERRESEKKRVGRGKDGHSGPQSLLSKDIAAHSRRAEQRDDTHEPSIAEDLENDEHGNDFTVSKDRMANQLPLGLLEEIRNHDKLAPHYARKVLYPLSSPAQNAERIAQDVAHKVTRSEDEESDREHISSATYFPHPGTLADSPTDDQLAARKPKQKAVPDGTSEDSSSHDVQVSLQSEDARDFLQGASHPPEIQLPEPALGTAPELPPTPVDSENESESGYESTLSVDEAEDFETTPTATPRFRRQSQRRLSARRPSQHVPAPVGAVELKPYKHQVGGHTHLYRFSRRAVCKQLNSKENKFYETVEHHHPELLGFMPRYIGVLNVTYRKDPKKRKQTPSELAKPEKEAVASQEKQPEEQLTQAEEKAEKAEQTRMISHSMHAPNAVPQVIFENNRHLIPDNLFRVPPRSTTPDLYKARSSSPKRENQSDGENSSNSAHRPSLKPASSWGFTSVNSQLRDHVLREVFAPPVIHRHDRRERNYHSRSIRRLPKHLRNESGQQRQNSIDMSSLQRQQRSNPQTPIGSLHSRLQQMHSDLGDLAGSDELLQDLKSGLSKSAEASDVDPSLPVTSARPSRRRHSGSGLKRATDIEGNHGDLEFHEDEAEAYTADTEEDVFSMDDLRKQTCSEMQVMQANDASPSIASGQELPLTAPRLDPAIDFSSPEPRNPETSLVQHDERVERFLLLEDLTSGMQKPCVLDLKMGTRQYGVEANEKKQASQRMKCKTTTSRELGVRVCGMQVYNVREQKYNFEDKYYGRDLKAGSEFQNALKRFFFDGIGHAQALKHIPSVLDKISQLDRIIRELPGYRLYASSLLMIYDRGDADENGKPKSAGPGKQDRPNQYPDIKLKIVDFANCVTAEDRERVLRKPCPPSNPDAIDGGYVRGLRTLKAYFQKIYQELHDKKYVERGEGEGMAIDQRGFSSGIAVKGWSDSVIEDPGEISI